jgi:peptide/nickel transport system substrate-binding protein
MDLASLDGTAIFPTVHHGPCGLRPAITVLATLLLVSCREAPSCVGVCGTAVVLGAEPDVLFPPTSQQDAGIAISDMMFLKLADIGPAMNTVGDEGFVPQLAASWDLTNPRAIRFSLDPRARWHDGTPVTTHDVVFTFAVYRDTLVNSPIRPLLEHVADVTAVDSLTVEFRLRRDYPERFFDTVYHVRILPRHVLDTIPRRNLGSHAFGRSPIGNGAFRFVQWVPGQYVELAADSTFFLGRPGLARVIWRVISDPVVGVTQLVAGEADVMPTLGVPENVERVRQAAHLRVVEASPPFYAYVGFNLRYPGDRGRPHPLFSDRDVRRALSMAVDRAAVVQAVLGSEARLAVGPMAHTLWIYSDSLRPLPFDTAEARRLLASRGWTGRDRDGVLLRGANRLEFELIVPTVSQPRRRAAVVLQEQLRRAGVGMHIVEVDFNLFNERASTGRFDAMFGAWSQDPSARVIEQSWGSAGLGAFNYGSYSSPPFDRLVRQATDARDPATARRLWHDAVRQINEDAPAIWIYSIRPLAGVHRRFQNVMFRADQWAPLLWTWRVPPDSTLPRDRLIAP